MKRYLLLVMWLICVLAIVGCGSDGDSPSRTADGDDDDVEMDPDDDDDDEDDDADDLSNGTVDDVNIRVLVNDYSEHQYYSFRAEEGSWITEPYPGEMVNVFISTLDPNWGSGNAYLDSTPEAPLITHFDGTEWMTESILPEEAIMVGTPVFFDEEGYTTAQAVIGYDENNNSIRRNKLFLTRQSDGTWIENDLPEISTDFSLLEIPFMESNGTIWLMANDYENQNGLALRKDETGWTLVDLPEVSMDWEIIRKVEGQAPDGGYWFIVKDHHNGEGKILSLNDGEWSVTGLPDISSKWELQEVFYCGENEAYATAVDGINNEAVILYYSEGEWSIDYILGDSDNYQYTRIACDADDVPWMICKIFADDKQHDSLISKRNGEWQQEQLPESGAFLDIVNIHFKANNTPFVLANAGKTSQNGYAQTYTLADGEWESKNLLKINGTTWKFVQSVIAENGTIIAVVHLMDGFSSLNVLQYKDGQWENVSPPMNSPYFELVQVLLY